MTRRRVGVAFLAILCLSIAVIADEPGPATDLYGDALPPGAIARLGTLRFRTTDSIQRLAYSPDGKKLVTQSRDKITLWDAASGRKLVEFAGDKVGPLAWRADGSGVMLVTEPGGKERIGDFTRERLKPSPFKGYEQIQSQQVRYSVIPGALDSPFKGYEQIQSQGIAARADNETFHGHAISPGGKYLVVGRAGNRERARPIAVWEIDTSKPIEEYDLVRELGPQQGNCHQIIFSPEGKFAGVISGPNVNSDASEQMMLLVVYNLATGKECYRRDMPIPQARPELLTLALAPEANNVAIGGGDSICRVYPIYGDGAEVSFGEPADVDNKSGWSALAFSRNVLIAVRRSDARLFMYDLKTAQAIRPPTAGLPQGALTIAVSGDGSRMAVAGGSSAIRTFDMATGRDLEPAIGHNGPVSGVYVFHDGARALTWGYFSPDQRLWDLSSGKELRRYALPLQPTISSPLPRLIVSPDEKLILALVNGKMSAVDLATGATVPAPGQLASATGHSLQSGADRRSIVLVDDESIGIWDWPEGRLRRKLDVEQEPKLNVKVKNPNILRSREVRLTPDSRLLASRDPFGLTVWEVDSGERRTFWRANAISTVNTMALLGDGRSVAISGIFPQTSEGDPPIGDVIGPKGAKGIGKKVPAGADGGKAKAGKKKGGGELGFQENPIGGQGAGGFGKGKGGGGFQGGGQGGFPGGQGGMPAGGQGGFGIQGGQGGFAGKQGVFPGGALGGFGGFGGGIDEFGGKKAIRSVRSMALWDLRSGTLMRTFEYPDSNQTRDIVSDPGGFVIATAEDDYDQLGCILLYEVATGQIRRRLPGHLRGNNALAFTPDGNRLVSVGGETTGLVWEVNLISATRGKKPATETELERAWTTLSERSTPAAYNALLAFASNPDQAIQLLQKRFRPTPPLNAVALDQLVADLEDEKFKVRERAAIDLEKLGKVAVPLMRSRAAKAQSREAKTRLNEFLERFDTTKIFPDELRALRALEFLEHAATPAARALIAELSSGEPTADLTIRASAAKNRLDRRK